MKTPQVDVFAMMRHFCMDAVEAGIDELLVQKVLGHIRARDVPALAAIGDLKTTSVTCGHEARFRLQISAFVKKNESLESTECVNAAYVSWLASERRCRITNRRLTHYYLHPSRLDPDMQYQVERARRVIASTLGDVRKFLRSIPERLSVTPGATANLSRRDALPVLKLGRAIQSPARAIPYLTALAKTFGYASVRFEVQPSNRIEFVPKSYKTRRTIAAEPTGVLPVQLCVDSWLKDRLRKRTGIDLSRQTLNQDLARQGSVDGSLATIDLEAASDSIALDLIHYLFPEEWAKVLCDLRSPVGTYTPAKGDSVSTQYAKYASMGNGTTFVVETLVFYALCKAVGSDVAVVYGDDIIVEVEKVAELKTLLHFLGFRVNQQKSFWDGPFRESCGGNYWQGVDITPFYIRATPKAMPDVCHVINGMARVSLPHGHIWKYLQQFTAGLPLVPYTQDTRSGIHITPRRAWELGKIRTARHNREVVYVQTFLGFSAQDGVTSRAIRKARRRRLKGLERREFIKEMVRSSQCYDSRALFLWYLRSTRKGRLSENAVQWNEAVDVVYTRRAIIYNPCATLIPSHLWDWEDVVT